MVMSGYPTPPCVQCREASEQSSGLDSIRDRLKMGDGDRADGQQRQQQQQLPPSNGSQAFQAESLEEDHRIKFEEWGFNIDRLFEVAYRFYRRNESKAFHPTFDQRILMNALIMQARFGNHDSGKAPDIGLLDLVGQRRRFGWALMHGMSKTEAMTKFICSLDEICPIFKAHAEAVKISLSGLSCGPHPLERLGPSSNALASQNQDCKISQTNAHLQNIYTSLCKQTHDQFKKYAEKQHPSDPAQQKRLIISLQEQYYQQYISQMHPELKCSLPSSSQTSNLSSNIPSSMPSPSNSELSTVNEVSASGGAADSHAAQVASSTEQASMVSTSASSNGVAGKRSGDLESILNVARPDNEHSVGFNVENNTEADISCEELNTEIPPVLERNPNEDNGQQPGAAAQLASHPIEQIVPSCAIQHETSELSQNQGGALVEPVKLHNKIDMSPIGQFESFPGPKMIQKATQRPTPIDLINPNLPTLPPLPSELQRHDKPVPETTTHASDYARLHSELERPSDQRAAQNETRISMENEPLVQDQSDGLASSTPSPFETHHFYHGINLNDGRAVAEAQEIPSFPLAEATDDRHNKPPEPWGTPDSLQHEQAPIHEPLESATTWTKGAVAEFKESLGGDKQGGVYEIKESTLVIIQVPTYPDGKYIYWEFATDDYDIGFGVDFVYERELAQPLALNIYEDNDDDDLEDLVDGDGWSHAEMTSRDPECGGAQASAFSCDRDRLVSEKRRRLANTVSIIPTYRRDSHEEVFVGRHKYPGQGYYLLRFDNTYSVLRSKTLYFRICYFI